MNNEMTIHTRAQPALLGLALAATVTAASLSILAGWQRGGLVSERVLLICVGVVLVVAAHLIPGLCRPHGWRVRALGAALWVGCMAATCYGHVVFFVMAQQHAGEIRSAVVPTVTSPGRNQAQISNDRAGVVARLARVVERKCGEKCAALRIERTTLIARLAALDAESVEVARRNFALDRADAERNAARVDPAAGLITALGVSAGRVDLFTGMVFAVVLECVACFSWLLALRTPDAYPNPVAPTREVSHGLEVTRVTPASKIVASVGNNSIEADDIGNSTTAAQTDDVTLVLTAIRDGKLRRTVAEIRKYLGCSQARAASVRKQVAAKNEQDSDLLQRN